MIRLLVTFAVSLLAYTLGQAQSTKDEIYLRATVQDVVPLTNFSGEITPVEVDPRFALTVRIESVDPTISSFSAGAVVAFAIHSPALLFGVDVPKGKTYAFSLRRRAKQGETSFFGLAVLGTTSTTTLGQTRYFPPRSLDEDARGDEFLSQWYSDELRTLDEPSLWELSKSKKEESYRFLWLRTFHHPIAVRIDIKADGSSQLTVKMTSGTGGFRPGHLVRNSKSFLTKEQTDSFLEKIKQHKFWELTPTREPGGNDGAEWILEGIKNGTYHTVDRWTPQDGPVRAIGLFMVNELAKLKIPAEELY